MSTAPLAQDDLFGAPISELHPVEPISVSPSAPLSDVIALLQQHNIGCVLVVENDALEGIFSERDILRHLEDGKLDTAISVGEIMTPDPECLKLDDPIAFALNRMELGGYRHVPLIADDRRPVGIVSVKDMVAYFVSRFPGEIYNLPPSPVKSIKTREGA